MPQTLLAFLSLLILMTFALNQQRAVVFSQRAVYESEVQMVAVDYAQGKFEEIQGRHYDENTKAFDPPTDAGIDDLTPALDLGPEDTTYDDVDDYDGYQEALVHMLNHEEFEFFVTIQVRYADPDDPETELATRAFGKRATITVYESKAARDAGRFIARLSRLYTIHGMNFN